MASDVHRRTPITRAMRVQTTSVAIAESTRSRTPISSACTDRALSPWLTSATKFMRDCPDRRRARAVGMLSCGSRALNTAAA